MREFGQYRIESLLGVGGMGEVHRAYDTRRDREVALKLLPMALSRDPDYQRRFRRESYTVARLREPHVIPIHDYGEIDDQLYIDMRLVDGKSLGMLLAEEGALRPSRAVALVTQVADALDAAHADGLVHRDVKPSNILVTDNDFVYVVDFGIAHVLGHTHSSLMAAGATVGTLDYMAPERFDNGSVDARTDVYSLACVLFECLTAQRPFPGSDLPTLMYGHLFADPPRISDVDPDVPPAFDAVIATGMAKNIDNRYPSACAFSAAARMALASARTATVVAGLPAPGAAQPGVVEQDAATEPVGVPGPLPDRVSANGAHPRPPTVNGFRTQPQGVPAATPPPTSRVPVPGTPRSGQGSGQRRTIIAVVAVAIAAILVAVGSLVVAIGGPQFGPVSGGRPGATPPVVANSIPKPTVATTLAVGPGPGYMEIAPNGTYGYVANRAAGVLTLVDTTRNTALGTIPVPKAGPAFIAFAPDGGRAYVTMFNNERTINIVGVLETATNRWIAEVPVGVRPFALDVTPDGKTVYVPNHDSGSITVIDTATNTAIGEIRVALNPHWVDVSPDGKRLYAANHESNVVSVIDTTTNAVLTTIPVDTSPHSIVTLRDRPVVLVCNYDGNSVSVIDTNTNTVTNTIPVGNHPQDITLSADGKHAYIATVDDNAIQVLDTTTQQLTATVPTGQSPTSVAVGPEGRQAYVTDLSDGTVTVLNIAGTA